MNDGWMELIIIFFLSIFLGRRRTIFLPEFEAVPYHGAMPVSLLLNCFFYYNGWRVTACGGVRGPRYVVTLWHFPHPPEGRRRQHPAPRGGAICFRAPLCDALCPWARDDDHDHDHGPHSVDYRSSCPCSCIPCWQRRFARSTRPR